MQCHTSQGVPGSQRREHDLLFLVCLSGLTKGSRMRKEYNDYVWSMENKRDKNKGSYQLRFAEIRSGIGSLIW